MSKSEVAVYALALGLTVGSLIIGAFLQLEGSKAQGDSLLSKSVRFVDATNPPALEVPGPFDHLKVGPYTYKVKWIKGLMVDCVEGEIDDGCTSAADSLIRISVIADKQHQRAIVLHEILHVVVNTTMADSPERMAYSSPLLLEIIRENPELMKFLEEK